MQQAGERLRVIKLILLGQFLAMILVGAGGFLIFDQLVGLSALLGGLIAWLPNTYFALRAFRYRGARAAQKIVRSFYAGAFGKMIGFAIVQTMNWSVPLFVALKERRRYTQ